MSVFPTKILLATDGSNDAVLAARATADLSREVGSELHIIHVWQADFARAYAVTMPGARYRWCKQQAERLLAKQVELVEGAGGKVKEAHLRRGRVTNEIVGLANELNTDLVVMGSRGLGSVERLVVGSVSESVAHKSLRPLLLLRGGPQAWPPARVVIGVDFTEESLKAAKLASSVGRLFGARTLLVHAYPLLELAQKSRVAGVTEADKEVCGAGKALEVLDLRLKLLLGQDMQTKTVAGDAANSILNASEEGEEPTMIAIGSRGLGTLKRLTLGSVSDNILRTAAGPMLIYRQPPSGADTRTAS